MAILISNKTDMQEILLETKRNIIMINLLINQEDMTIINVYTNNRKQNLRVMRG